jgi:cleavage and polyadenylation specificity factor subunit 1
MQCYTELIAPSGVTCALSLPFTASDANNLIVAKSSLLQIFFSKQTSNGQDTKLILVAEYHLPGTVTSLGRVSILNSRSGGEAILVALRDAKLSLVEWDPQQHSISTISIHYYESDDLLLSPWPPDIRDCISRLTIDPSSRCAAFNFGGGNLAIIPFHQVGDDLAMDDYDDPGTSHANGSPVKETNGDASHINPYSSSFVLPLTMLESGLLHPIDLAFLYEYREPTFGILYSTAAKSSNMLYERKDIVIYAVFTLDLDQKASTNLLSIQKLPNDLYKIKPLPLPVGGALLIGSNELIHIDQSGKSTAIGVNEFARQCSSFSMADRSDYELRLEGSQIELLGNTNGDMLMILATGEVAVLSFQLDGRSVSSISLHIMPVEQTNSIVKGPASCMAPLGLGQLFIGSEESHSLLLGTAKKTSYQKRQGSRANLHAIGTRGSESESDGDDGDEEGDEDDDLYGEIVTSAANGHTNESIAISGTSLQLLDRLPSIAPLRDVAFGRPLKRKRGPVEEQSNNNGTQLELVIASGRGQAGGVAILSRELDPQVVYRTSHNDVDWMWSFPVKRFKKESREDQDVYHDHVILSKGLHEGAGESSLFTISDGKFVAKEGTEFDSSAGSTVEVGSVRGGNYTVQVLQTEVRVYDFGELPSGARWGRD